MELADKVTERSDRGQTGLTKFSLEQQLSLTEVDQTCTGKARSVVGIIKVYKRKLWERPGRLRALFHLYWASRDEHTGPSKDQTGRNIIGVVDGWQVLQDTHKKKKKCVHFYSENSKRQRTNKREALGNYRYELRWFWEEDKMRIQEVSDKNSVHST